MCQQYPLPTNQQLLDWIMYAAELTDSVDLAKQVSVEWSNRMTSARGRAYLTQKHIKFSTHLMSRSSLLEQQQCVCHEYIHIVAWNKHRDNGHGFWWGHLMRKCGFEARRCHNIDNSDLRAKRKPRQKFTLTCHCGPIHQVTSVIMKKINNGAKYTCRKCRSFIHSNSVGAV